MRPPIFVRPLTEAERVHLRARLRSADAFTVRRCQTLLGQPVLLHLAYRPACPDDVWRARGPDRRVADEVVRGPAVTAARDSRARRILASSSSAPDIPEVLARDPDLAARDTVAVHPGAPAEALSELSADPGAHVRAAVAGSPRTPEGTLRRLAGDGDRAVSTRLARNTPAPGGVVAGLARDPDPRVAGEARRRLRMPETHPR